MISRRCLSPTPRSRTGRIHGMRVPNVAANCSASASARRRSKIGPKRHGTRPSTRFSTAVNSSTSWNRWWTMPIPSWMAIAGSAMSVGAPSISIVPASGRTMP